MEKIKWQQLNNIICIDNEKSIDAFNSDWSQEDVAHYFESLLERYREISLDNVHLGADRVSYDVTWRQSHYWLHFECYSQSIWFEAIDLISEENLNAFYRYLTNGQ
ncbi:DUF3630 family protein [Thalassotalea sediminis]|uniref:DUF3630 family protein n=1 Tax=Thalassotalea sediminis TaxID=1759089 RepID=UPI0025736332|nr:DUF3630 family protein [Thalassotalea sediminis]